MGGRSGKPHLNRSRNCRCMICGESDVDRKTFFNGLKHDFRLYIRDEVAEMKADEANKNVMSEQ